MQSGSALESAAQGRAMTLAARQRHGSASAEHLAARRASHPLQRSHGSHAASIRRVISPHNRAMT
jgi:hypothetical protein